MKKHTKEDKTMTQANYIIFRISLETPKLIPFLFSQHFTVREVANFVSRAQPSLVLMSGGQVTIDLESKTVTCYNGREESSSLRTGRDDAEVIKREFCHWELEE